ncbi:MAG: DUF4349 domain-containing protein [Nitrososphaerota archaeon]|nr:DUF4349 domain-containing protein [Nitrososphaerota archaeon]
MDVGRKITLKKALWGVAVGVVAAGIVVGVFSDFAAPPASYLSVGTAPQYVPSGDFSASNGLLSVGGTNSYGGTQVISGGETTYSVTTATTTTTTNPGPSETGVSGNVTQGAPSGNGGLIEFSSQVQLQDASPQQTASGIVALAYAVGGYVAYQSTYSSSANVVIRVPSSQYQETLAKVEALGTVEGLTSNSNDVSVQYTDLNATLASLQTEQGALLRLLNASTSVNATLAIESQLQGVDQQINEAVSQILQTKTLIDFATIDVTISQTTVAAPLSVALTTTPKEGEAPLSVTFNAVVKGGEQPYLVNYNFGDGSASQGEILIHTFTQPGAYNVTVTATDQNGTAVEQSVLVHVSAAPGLSGLGSFIGTVSGLFVNVVEGIAEVAVVVLPIAAVGAAVAIPLQKRASRQKEPKQTS